MNRQQVWSFYFVLAPFDDNEECALGFRLRTLLEDYGFNEVDYGTWIVQCNTEEPIKNFITAIEDLSPAFYYAIVYQRQSDDGLFKRHPQLFYESVKVRSSADSHPEYRYALNPHMPDIECYLSRQMELLNALRKADLHEQNLALRRARGSPT